MEKVFIGIILLLLCSCSGTNVSTGQTIELFDTAAYLDSEFGSTPSTRNVKKTIRYNSEVQALELTAYNISKDLDILKLANINNPNWVDKYEADTTIVGTGTVDITYTAVDPKLQIRTFVVRKSENSIVQFESFEQRNALISNSEKRIVYTSGSGYSINTKSQNLFSSERSIAVEIQFKSN